MSASPAPKRPPDSRLPRDEQELMAEMEAVYHDIVHLLRVGWKLVDRRRTKREAKDGS